MNERKPRPDSKLKTLPEERQEQIAEFARTHSLAQTVVWLQEDGLQTSAAALSGWLSWYLLRDQLQRNESTVDSVLNQLKTARPDLTESELFAAGQSFFSALAIEQRDAKSWKRTQDLRIKAEVLKLEEKKFQRTTCELFLAWHSDKQAREVASSGATNSEKIERLGKMLFGEDWD
ncbi:MAG TPA: hypothetical protein VK474_00430 [Chthoniobacterales bacterium]|nr:hypothetical protein [Chthoniobacterales bacterium]